MSLLACTGLLVLAAPALAGNQFTLDHGADSSGPVVVDQQGNAYVAWLHRSGAQDVVMFCKFAPGATHCPGPITLPVGLAAPFTSTDTPYPVLGPGNTVYIVAPSYDTNQLVIWQSTDGGVTFSSPVVGPTAAQLSNSNLSDVCQVASSLDDVLPMNAFGGQYDRSQGTKTLGTAPVEFEMASDDPFATWSFGFYGESCVVESDVTVTPGTIPAQWFNFGGSDTVSGIMSDQATLGWAGGGSAGCAVVAPGDEVEAYSNGGTPEMVKFFRWSSPVGPCAKSPGGNLGPSGENNWAGASTIAQGALPRLAGGLGGLFLLSADAARPPASAPTAVDVRRYDVATHSFGPAHQLAVLRHEGYDTTIGGGIGENYTTGEVAVVWPGVKAAHPNAMHLYVSTDGGAQFSQGQAIGVRQFGYEVLGNARVAVAGDGNGVVTWQDSGGLHVADFAPMPVDYKRLTVVHPATVQILATCLSPKHNCTASATVAHNGTTIASGTHSVPSGRTTLLSLPLSGPGQTLLKAAGGRLAAMLALAIKSPQVKTQTIITPTTLVG
jgi:hypothetical protein